MTNGLYLLGRQALLSGAACLALAADRPQFGVQGLGSWPTGSMRGNMSSDNGYGLGLFVGCEAGPGREWRLAYDGVWYPKDRHAAQVAGVPAGYLAAPDASRESRTHALTAQYLRFLANDAEGLYYKLGLGAMNYLTRVETTLAFPASGSTSLTVLEETGTRLACLAGVGYEFNAHWGVLAQYTFIPVNNHTLGAVQGGVSYRF